mgnify:CR=1 FL=1
MRTSTSCPFPLGLVRAPRPPDDHWPGRRGLVHEAMLADFPNLQGFEVYACGSVQMVQTAVPSFIAQGLDENFCHSDAFVPAARVAAAEGAD